MPKIWWIPNSEMHMLLFVIYISLSFGQHVKRDKISNLNMLPWALAILLTMFYLLVKYSAEVKVLL